MEGDLVLDMLKWVRVSVGHSCVFWAAFYRIRKIIRLICFPPSTLGKKGVQEIACFGMNFWCVLFVFCIHTKYGGKLLINVNEWDLHWNALKIGWYKWLQVRYEDAWKFKKFITAINDLWMKTDSVGQIPNNHKHHKQQLSKPSENFPLSVHKVYWKYTFFSSPGNIPKR